MRLYTAVVFVEPSVHTLMNNAVLAHHPWERSTVYLLARRFVVFVELVYEGN